MRYVITNYKGGVTELKVKGGVSREAPGTCSKVLEGGVAEGLGLSWGPGPGSRRCLRNRIYMSPSDCASEVAPYTCVVSPRRGRDGFSEATHLLQLVEHNTKG